MQTLTDIANRIAAPQGGHPVNGMPAGWPAKGKLKFPAAGAVALPKDVDGLKVWSAAAPTSGPLAGRAEAERIRSVLAASPTLVQPLPARSPSELQEDAGSGRQWRREASPSSFLAAVAVRDGTGDLIYGWSKSTVVESMYAFGRSVYAEHTESWFTEFEAFADDLALQFAHVPNARLMGEPGSRPWGQSIVFLADSSRETALPADWQQGLRAVAGLYSIDLDVRHCAPATVGSLKKTLSSTPPAGVIASLSTVPSYQDLFDCFLKARKTGFTATVGVPGSHRPPERSQNGQLDDLVLELGWHLREFGSWNATPSPPSTATWAEVAPMVKKLEGDHFILSASARDSLASNPYPKPSRMFEQLEGLQRLAKVFHDQGGTMAGRLKEAGFDFGIEIAIFDSNMPSRTVVHCEKSWSCEPHVKVDDNKSARDCGRIYFALDHECNAFIVDHIGLHDYY